MLRSIWSKTGTMTAVERAVITTMVLHADNDTGICWHTQETIAAEAGYGERCVRTAILSLEKQGFISRSKARRGGKWANTTYTLHHRIVVPVNSPSELPNELPTPDAAGAAGVDDFLEAKREGEGEPQESERIVEYYAAGYLDAHGVELILTRKRKEQYISEANTLLKSYSLDEVRRMIDVAFGDKKWFAKSGDFSCIVRNPPKYHFAPTKETYSARDEAVLAWACGGPLPAHMETQKDWPAIMDRMAMRPADPEPELKTHIGLEPTRPRAGRSPTDDEPAGLIKAHPEFIAQAS